jgi:dCTP deaminase
MAGFWTAQLLEQRLPDIVDGFDPALVSESSYELRLGDEAYVTGPDLKTQVKLSVPPRDRVVIPPGQFALLLTRERITMPTNALGLISIKFGLKRRGLLNVSGFHVDPGFDGKLEFAVYNAGPQELVISQGAPTFLLWVCDLTDPTSKPYGRPEHPGTRQHQDRIPDDDVMDLQGSIFSPHALAARVSVLEGDLRRLKSIGTFFVIPLSVALTGSVIANNWDPISNFLSKLWPF